MAAKPDFQNSYPIKQSEEHRVSRRQFAKFCGCSAIALGAGVPIKRRLSALPKAESSITVATAEEVPVGGYKLFNYPTADHLCILIRRTETVYAAFSQSCTHLMCPVHFRAETNQFVCPCHEGFFDATDGTVIAGPPRRSLPQYFVSVAGNKVIVVPEIINGPDTASSTLHSLNETRPIS